MNLLGRLSLNVRRPIGEAIFRLPSVLSRPLRDWIRDFGAEVCFSTLGNGLMLRTVIRVAEEAHIPIVPYFTDDWISTLYKGDFLEGWLRASMKHWFGECLKRAPVRLVPTRDMNEEYTKRYGGRFLQMNYSVPEVAEPVSPSRREGSLVRLVYMGGLAPDRSSALREIGEALAILAGEGLSVEFLVYTPSTELKGQQVSLNLPPFMRTVDAVPYCEVPRILSEADVVIHAESFHPEFRRWTRYSLSTKIPEYLMAGRCVFAYGPGDIASIRYLKETGAGFVVDTPDPGTLREGLRAVLSSPEVRFGLASRARAVALENHRPAIQRQQFLEAIRLACGLEPVVP